MGGLQSNVKINSSSNSNKCITTDLVQTEGLQSNVKTNSTNSSNTSNKCITTDLVQVFTYVKKVCLPDCINVNTHCMIYNPCRLRWWFIF